MGDINIDRDDHRAVRVTASFDKHEQSYVIRVHRAAGSTVIQPGLFDKEAAERIAAELDALYEAEKPQRIVESDRRFRQFEENQRERAAERAAEDAKLVGVQMINVNRNSARFNTLARVEDMQRFKATVRYESDGRKVTTSRDNFKLVPDVSRVR